MEPRLAACEARRGGQLGELVLTAHAVQFEPATGASGGSSAVLLGDVTACAVDADGLLTLELADGAPQQAYAVAAAAIPRARRLVARLQQMLQTPGHVPQPQDQSLLSEYSTADEFNDSVSSVVSLPSPRRSSPVPPGTPQQHASENASMYSDDSKSRVFTPSRTPRRSTDPALKAQQPEYPALRRPLLMLPPEWDGETTTACSACGTKFGRTRRRHHCRMCGSSCCSSCSPHIYSIPFQLDQLSAQRVCLGCEPFLGMVSCAARLAIQGTKVVIATGKEAHRLQMENIDALGRLCTPEKIHDVIKRSGLAALVNACMFPAEDVQAHACQALSKAVALTATHPELIRLGVLQALANVLKHTGEATTVLSALASLHALLSNPPVDVAAAVREALIPRMVTLAMAESPLKVETVAGWILKDLASQDALRSVLLDRDTTTYLLAEALRSQARPQAQEALLCALAHLSCVPEGAALLAEVHFAIAMPLMSCIQSLLAALDVDSVQVKTLRRRSLSHAACILANMCACPDNPLHRGHTHMAAQALILLAAQAVSDETQEHALRGLANVSANPPYASPLLAALDDIVASVLPGVDYVLHEHALRLLHNLALFEKRRTALAIAPYEDSVVKLARDKRHAQVAKLATGTLLLLDMDVVTEDRTLSAQDRRHVSVTPYPVQFTRPSVYYDQSDEPPTSPTALSATLERVQGAAENDKHSGQGGGSAAADGSSSSSSAANRLSMMGARRAARGGAAVLDRLRLLTEDYRRQLATYAQLQQDEAHQVATTEFVGAATRSLQARLEAVEAQLQELRPCLTGEAQQQRSS